VVLSTLNSKLEIAKAYQLGARSYLVKPPRAVDLKAIAIAAKELTAPNAEGVDGAEATLAKRLIELDERLTLKFLTASSTEADLKSLRVACYAKEIAAWMDGH
jgi:DNA-binding NarL/FixJ family response regulator